MVSDIVCSKVYCDKSIEVEGHGQYFFLRISQAIVTFPRNLVLSREL